MSYTTTIPINDSTITAENRDIYLEHAKMAKADRLFLNISRCFQDDKMQDSLDKLKEDIEFFSSKGFEVGVWLAQTIGHGGELAFDMNSPEASFTHIVGINGKVSSAFCPLDENFRKAICSWIKRIAETGTRLIMLDDDFRLSTRDYGIGCACEKHIKLMNDALGENVGREVFERSAFCGKPNKYRKAWLNSQGYALKLLASDIRKAVDEVDENIRIGLCSTFPVWDVDGVTSIEIARILAGNTKPILRLLVAPYWSVMSTFPMPNILETSVMYASFCENSGIEIISEGDTSPRPRYYVPSGILEQYDAYLRADGRYTGILKYMEDYTSNPSYDDGYIKRHVRDLPDLERINELFSSGRRIGARIIEKMTRLSEMELPNDFSPYSLRLFPTSKGASMLARCSIPTTYEKDGTATLAFGENASELCQKDYKNGVILDAYAAKYLTEKGVDVGLENILGWKNLTPTREYFPHQKEKAYILRGNARFLDVKMSSKAQTDSYIMSESTQIPLCYRYQNDLGQKFLVYLFDTLEIAENNGLFNSFARQRQLFDGIEWISGNKLPVKTAKNPDLVTLCKENESGMTIGLFNCHADSVIEPVLEVDKKYTSAEFFRCTGILKDGVVTLSELPSMGFAAIALSI